MGAAKLQSITVRLRDLDVIRLNKVRDWIEQWYGSRPFQMTRSNLIRWSLGVTITYLERLYIAPQERL